MNKDVHKVEVLLGGNRDDASYFSAHLDFNKVSMWWVPRIEEGDDACVNMVVDGDIFTFKQTAKLQKLLKEKHYEQIHDKKQA